MSYGSTHLQNIRQVNMVVRFYRKSVGGLQRDANREGDFGFSPKEVATHSSGKSRQPPFSEVGTHDTIY